GLPQVLHPPGRDRLVHGRRVAQQPQRRGGPDDQGRRRPEAGGGGRRGAAADSLGGEGSGAQAALGCEEGIGGRFPSSRAPGRAGAQVWRASASPRRKQHQTPRAIRAAPSKNISRTSSSVTIAGCAATPTLAPFPNGCMTITEFARTARICVIADSR